MQLELHGITYRTVKAMDAFTQLKIARRLGPAVPVLEGVIKKENLEKDRRILVVLMFSHIAEEDMLYVVDQCLTVVGRVQANNQIADLKRNGSLMFDDISMSDLIEIATAVIEETLGDFFRTALSPLEARTNPDHSSQ